MIGMDVLRNNFQLMVLLIIWLVAGAYTGPGVFLIIPASLLLLFSGNRFPEIFIGFIFMLVISDNLEQQMLFAKSFKNIYILMLFFFLIITMDQQNRTINIYKYFIPYFIFALIGMMFSPILSTSFQKLLSYILLFIAVPNYVLRCYEQIGKEFFRNLLYFLFVIVVAGFIIRFYNFEIAYSHGGRFRGLFGNPNGLGTFMIMFFILFTIVNSKFTSLFSRLEKIIFYVLMFYFTYKTGSRNALLAVLLFFAFYQLFMYSKFLGFILFFLILISMEFIIANIPKFIVALGLGKSLRVETLEEGSGRLIAWEFAWSNIKESILIGKGIGYDEYMMRKNYKMLSKAGHEGGVHNTYLIMWLNTGLLGLIFYLRGLFILFIKASKHNSYAFPVLFAVLFSINFEPWLAASLNPYTILFLVIVTLLLDETFNSETDEIENDEEMETEPEVG